MDSQIGPEGRTMSRVLVGRQMGPGETDTMYNLAVNGLSRRVGQGGQESRVLIGQVGPKLGREEEKMQGKHW